MKSTLFAAVLLGALLASMPLAASQPCRWTLTVDTVRDNNTGRMWQRTAAAASYSQPDAVTYCQNLSLGGFTDWRLPSARELLSIQDVTFYPVYDPTVFLPDTSEMFWSANSYLSQPGSYWYVRQLNGDAYYAPAATLYRVRCVR